MSDEPEAKEKGFLRKQFEFAGSMILHPIKTVKNIAAGLTDGPIDAGKVIFGTSLAFGVAALTVGAMNVDPLLTVIGATFTSIGANHLDTRGGKVREARQEAASQAATVTPEPEKEPLKTDAPPEETASERLDRVLSKSGEGRSGFKPNLGQFKQPSGPDNGVGGPV